MIDQSIACPSCGKKIPLTRALRAEIETSVRADYDRQLQDELERARKEAARAAEKRSAQELEALRDELRTQAKELA
jgi:DNA repair exonuclease SbcCD ATPase subunit